MTHPSRPRDRWVALALALVAAVPRLPGLYSRPRDIDELANFATAARGPVVLMAGETDLTRPPLWDLGLWAVSEAGGGRGAARLVSVVAGAALAALVYRVARRWTGTGPALVAGLGVAFTPVVIELSQVARPDALLLLLVACSWAVSPALNRGSTHQPGSPILHGVVSVLALWTHPWAVLALAPQVALDVQQGLGSAARRWGLIAAATVPSMVWLMDLGSGAGPPLGPPHPSALFWALHSFAYGEHLSAAITMVLVCAALLHASPPRPTDPRTPLAAWLLGPPLLGIVISVVGPPIVDVRYLAVSLPAMWLLVALGLEGTPALARRAATLLLPMMGALVAWHHGVTAARIPADWEGLAADLAPVLAEDDLLIARYATSWSEAVGRIVRPFPGVVPDAQAVDDALDAAAGHRLVWLIEGAPDSGDAAQQVFADRAVVLLRWHRPGVAAVLLRPGGRTTPVERAELEPAANATLEDDRLFFFANGVARFTGLRVPESGDWIIDVVGRGDSAGGVPAQIDIALPGAFGDDSQRVALPTATGVRSARFSAPAGAGPVEVRFVNDGTATNATGALEDRNMWIDRVVLSAAPSGG